MLILTNAAKGASRTVGNWLGLSMIRLRRDASRAAIFEELAELVSGPVRQLASAAGPRCAIAVLHTPLP
jgi:hypothetical protein